MIDPSPHAYPMHLRLAGKPVLVAGAGRVATRKIERLVQSGARVEVVAKVASRIVTRLAQQGSVALRLRPVAAADVEGKFLVLAATDDGQENARLARAARERGILVSRVDAPEDSDFTVPALARAPHVEATISTSGTAPSASRRLGKELAQWLSQGPDRFVAEIASARSVLRGHPEGTERLRRLAEGELFEACTRGDEAVIQRCRERALAGLDPSREAAS